MILHDFITALKMCSYNHSQTFFNICRATTIIFDHFACFIQVTTPICRTCNQANKFLGSYSGYNVYAQLYTCTICDSITNKAISTHTYKHSIGVLNKLSIGMTHQFCGEIEKLNFNPNIKNCLFAT